MNSAPRYLTPDQNSNPILSYMKWVVSDTMGAPDRQSIGIMNDAYTDFPVCPYDIDDQWQYEHEYPW